MRKRAKVGPPALQQILDGMQLGVAVLQLEDPGDLASFRIVSVNAGAARLLGPVYQADTAVGKTLGEAYPDSLQTELPRRYAEVIRTGIPLDLGDVRGTRDPDRLYSVKVFPLPDRRVGIVFDEVTSRRQAEDRVKRSERQLARAQQLGRMGSWVWEIAADKITWSEELHRIYGVSPDSFRATFAAFLEHVHPDDRAMVERTVREALERRQPFRFKERIIRPGGEMRILDSQGDVVVDDRGNPTEMFGICRDITDDERAERALRESEERFAKTVQANPTAICVMTLDDGRLLEVNARFLALLGTDQRNQVVGRRVAEVGMWTDVAEYQRAVKQLREQRSVREATVTYRTRDGRTGRALAALELIELAGRDCMLALFWRM